VEKQTPSAKTDPVTSLNIKKIKIDAAALKSITPEQRSTILLLGHMANEANWFRKLLTQAVLGISDEPEGQAQFGLTVSLGTILASKLHEGWLALNGETLGPVLSKLALSDELKALRKELKALIEDGLIANIRNKIGFHYPTSLDFVHLAAVDDEDTKILTTEMGFVGDLFSSISSIALMDALIDHGEGTEWQDALVGVWNQVTEVTGRYCFLVSELLALAVETFLPGKLAVEQIDVPDAPTLAERPLIFFARPPDNLDELIAEAKAAEKLAEG